jgi:DNA-directed RNA polymerase specialized sigma24 family protein
MKDPSFSWVWDYREYVNKICLKVLHEYPQEAEDIAQNVLLKALQTPSLVQVQKRGGWLRRIAINECMNYLRGLNHVPRLAGRKPRRRRKLAPETYAGLPEDLREGIEKSLDLIVDLFRTRSNLRDKLKLDFQHSRRILKVIKSIAEARKLLGKFRYPDPDNKGLLRLRDLREMPDPAFSGRPEEDKKVEDLLTEAGELEKKFGAALNLYEAQLELSAEMSNSEVELRLAPIQSLDLGFLVDYQSPWIDHLSEIAGMKVSPLNLIYKVWSKAPGFRAGGSGKYLSRKRMSLVLKHHKIESKGSAREFLFSSIKNITMIESPKIAFERFRKAGYGQALQKKYKPMIDLIYRKSFRN